MLKPVDNTNAQTAKLTNVQPGKEFSSVLILQNPGKPGNYNSLWRICYKDESSGQLFYIGEAFQLTLAVQGAGENQQPSSPVNKYDQAVVDKAKELKGILADVSMDDLLAFVNKKPKLSLEELINEYLTNWEW